MSQEIVRLQQQLQKRSLLDRIKKPEKPVQHVSVLLIDCSYSMNEPVNAGGRKVDAMRKVVETLRATHQVPMIGFGMIGKSVAEITTIPEPAGGTPMAEAIEMAKAQGFTHAVLVSDGVANNPGAAMEAAGQFGGPIDTFYIGPPYAAGAQFLKEMSQMTKGQHGVTDLGSPKELAGKIVALLGDGSTPPPKKGAIEL